MISLINFLNKAVIVFFAGLILLSGCAGIKKPVASLALTDGSDARVEKFQVAVLPVQNLSGAAAPIKDIRQSLINNLKKQGFGIIEEDVLERFMARHRIRYTGGIDRVIAQALREETKADAVLITSLELYDDRYPPKIALTSRLVSTGDKPVILWIDGIGLAGDDSPGIFELGLIEDPLVLQEKALQFLTMSLMEVQSGRRERIDTRAERKKFLPEASKCPPLASPSPCQYVTEYPQVSEQVGEKKFQPKEAYRSPVIAPNTKYIVAVIPFLNESERKNAGEIVALHFVRELRKYENLDVIEPGVIREELLGLRIIMEGGVSLANASLVLGTLNADLVLSGRVLDYQDYQGTDGTPKVDFSIVVIERKSQEIVWASKSYNRGDDGVFFFDRGKINTANEMASQMVHSVVKMMIQ